MRHSTLRAALAGTLALVLCSCDRTPAAPTGPTVSVTDVTGDAGSAINTVPAPDLTAATLTLGENTIVADVTLASGTLSQALTNVIIVFDVDESASTGAPGIDAAGDDAAGFGTDYFVQCVGGQCEVRTGSGLTVTGTVSASYPGSGQMHVVVPLTMIGNDDGRLRFKVLTRQTLAGGSTTGVLDVMPNVGIAAATLH
jgi:hypothetical protein